MQDLTVEDPPTRTRWFDRPVGRPMHAVCVLLGLFIVWIQANPYAGMFEWLFAIWAVIPLAGYWFVRLCVCLWRTRRVAPAFLVAPLGGMLLFGLSVANAPVKVVWAVNQGTFDAVVRDLQPLPAPTPSDCESDACISGVLNVPKRIGMYRVDGAERVHGGIIFWTDQECGLLDNAGISWFPDGRPEPEKLHGFFESPDFTHLRGPWYSWCASW